MKKTRKKVVSLLLAIILFFSVTMVKTEAKVLDEYKPLIVKAVDVVEVVEDDTDIAAYVNSQKEEFELVSLDMFQDEGYDIDDLFDAEAGIYTDVFNSEEITDYVMIDGELTEVARQIVYYATVRVTKSEESSVDFVSYTVSFDTNGKGEIKEQKVFAGEKFEEIVDDEYAYQDYIVGYYMDPDYTIPYLGQRIVEDTTIYVKINAITEVNITVPAPTVGESVSIEEYPDGDWDWSEQTNPPYAIVPDGAYYSFIDTPGYSFWVKGFDEEGFDTPFVGTFEYNTDYYADIWLIADEGYVFTDDVVVTVNGQPVNEIFYNDFGELDIGVILTTPEEPAEYEMLDGEGQDYNLNSSDPLAFRANIPFEKFQQSGVVYVDEEVVDSSNYTASEGSTIITFNDEYTNSLEDGEHSLRIAVSNGAVDTTFNITKSKTSNPQTGDNILLFVGLLIVSIAGTYIAIRKIK